VPCLDTGFPWGVLYPMGHMGYSHSHIYNFMKKHFFVIVITDKCSFLLVEAIAMNTF